MRRVAIFVVESREDAEALKPLISYANFEYNVDYVGRIIDCAASVGAGGGVGIKFNPDIPGNSYRRFDAAWNGRPYPDPSWSSYTADGPENVYTKENFQAGINYLLGLPETGTRAPRKVLGRRNLVPLKLP